MKYSLIPVFLLALGAMSCRPSATRSKTLLVGESEFQETCTQLGDAKSWDDRHAFTSRHPDGVEYTFSWMVGDEDVNLQTLLFDLHSDLAIPDHLRQGAHGGSVASHWKMEGHDENRWIVMTAHHLKNGDLVVVYRETLR